MSITNIKNRLSYEAPPDQPGLYIISINPAKLSSLIKLGGEKKENDRIIELISKLLLIDESRYSESILHEVGKKMYLSRSITIASSPKVIELVSFLKENRKELASIAKHSNIWGNYLPPIYIGITIEQGLNQRIEQHKRSLEGGALEERTNFGVRAREFGIAWTDFVIGWMAVDSKEELNNLKIIERFLHNTLKPVFSYK